MPLEAGTRIGSYELTGQIGAGGMGVVYRAEDTKFDRSVAIKFLPEGYAAETFRRRFEREVRAVSSLNHPHILTVLDIGEHEGHPYLVTEFVEGGTLREWLSEKKRTWRQVVALLVGVADGLAAAHQSQILHRDLKPENVLLDGSGYAKLADFGLAKQLESGESSLDAMSTPTVSLEEALTDHGCIVGTIAYMSPEQTTGGAVDERSDIFSFGVLLHEGLSGVRPFDGASDLERMAAIRESAPTALPESIPERLRWIVRKALEKDPGERYQNMQDLVVDLRRVGRSTDVPVADAGPAAKTATGSWLPWAITAVVALAAILGWVLRDDPGGTRTSVPSWTTPNLFPQARITNLTGFPGDEYSADISPDGGKVIFLADREDRFDVWHTRTDRRGGLQNLTRDHEGDLLAAGGPRPLGFTHDGAEVWMHRNFTLPEERFIRIVSVPIEGAGEPRPLFEDHSGADPTWSEDGRWVYYDPADGDPLYITDPGGLNPTLLLPKPEAGVHQHNPRFSLDGEWVYFTRGVPAAGRMAPWRVRVDGGDEEQLSTDVPYVNFPTPIDERTVLFIGRDPDGYGPWLWAYDVETGETRRLLAGIEKYLSVAASRDGRKIVVTRSEPTSVLWTVPLADSGPPAPQQVARAIPIGKVPGASGSDPRFAGEDLYFLSSRGSRAGLWRRSGDDSLTEVLRGEDRQIEGACSVSPDGLSVVVCVRRGDQRVLLRVGRTGTLPQDLCPELDVLGAGSWNPAGTHIVVDGARIGPDGKWVDPGLHVIDVERGTSRPIVEGKASNPVWSPEGDRILYTGRMSEGLMPLLLVTPDGDPVSVKGLEDEVGHASRYRFLRDGSIVVLEKPPSFIAGDFWHVDPETGRKRRLTRLSQMEEILSFDIAPDGKSIVFDRLRKNADIVLIELPPESQ